jgi:hypothetical protein
MDATRLLGLIVIVLVSVVNAIAVAIDDVEGFVIHVEGGILCRVVLDYVVKTFPLHRDPESRCIREVSIISCCVLNQGVPSGGGGACD